MKRSTFVVLGALTDAQQEMFAPLRGRAELVFGAGLADVRSDDLATADGLFVWGKPHDSFEAILAGAPSLRWVHSTGVGIEHLLVPALLRRRIVLTNSRGVYSSSVAELAVALLLALVKHVPALVADQREHRWAPQLNQGLFGETAVIVGMGNIGVAVARVLTSFGMHVIGVRRTQRPSPWAHEVVKFTDIQRVLPRTQYVVVCCPETDETRGLIGRRELQLLPRGAIVVNVARGSIVDENALIAALRSGHLAGAGLDVFETEPLPADSPLWKLPGVIVSPHYPNVVGWERDVILRFVEIAERFLDGRRLPGVVDKRRGY